jgi:hypothetical protein
LARFGPNSPIILHRSSADGWMKLCLLCIKGSPNPIPLPHSPLSLLPPPLPLSHPTPSPSLLYRSTVPSPSDPHRRYPCLRSPRPTPMTPARAPPTGGGLPHAFPPPSSSPSPLPLLAAPTARRSSMAGAGEEVEVEEPRRVLRRERLEADEKEEAAVVAAAEALVASVILQLSESQSHLPLPRLPRPTGHGFDFSCMPAPHSRPR